MELIVISESKLKIMLTAPDMEKYDLESSRMDCIDPHTREAFRHIFRDARAEIGFDTEGSRLFVQLYSSKEGGCEIFVTKLGKFEGREEFRTVGVAEESQNEAPPDPNGASLFEAATQPLSEGELRLLRDLYREEEGMSRLDGQEFSSLLLGFRELEPLLGACRRLCGCGFSGRSSVYISDEGHLSLWYLLIELPCRGFTRLPRKWVFLREYGEVLDAEAMVFVEEHSRCIAREGAVEILGKC